MFTYFLTKVFFIIFLGPTVISPVNPNFKLLNLLAKDTLEAVTKLILTLTLLSEKILFNLTVISGSNSKETPP